MSKTCVVCNRESENAYIVGDHLAFCLACKHYMPRVTPQGVVIPWDVGASGALLTWRNLDWALKALAAFAKSQVDLPHVAADLYNASLEVITVRLRAMDEPTKVKC
jgi:hypothetical protein